MSRFMSHHVSHARVGFSRTRVGLGPRIRRGLTSVATLASVGSMMLAGVSSAASPSNPSPIAHKYGGVYGWCYTADSPNSVSTLYRIDITEYFCTDGDTVTYHSTGREATNTYPAEQLEWGQSTSGFGAYNQSFFAETQDRYGYCPHATAGAGVWVVSGSIEIKCAWVGNATDQITVYAGLGKGRTDLSQTDHNPAVPVAYFRADNGQYYYATYDRFR